MLGCAKLSDMAQIAAPPWTLGDRLTKARKFAGLSQTDLADYLGIARRSITSYENDETRPSRAVLIAWALRCDVPLDWLEHGERGPDSPASQGKRSSRCTALLARQEGTVLAFAAAQPRPLDAAA